MPPHDRCRLVGVFLTFWCLLSASQVAAEPFKRHVLLLNSYHQNTPWVARTTEAVLKQFEPHLDAFDLHIENMDTKRRSYDASMDGLLTAYYRQKFATTPFSVVIASDNNAFEYARAHKSDLFPEASVVFCGINDFDPQSIAGQSSFTGVTEFLDIEATLEVALGLLPDTDTVFVINDSTESGVAVTRQIQRMAAHYQGRLRFEFAPDESLSQLKGRLNRLLPRTLVLFGTYMREPSGRFVTPEEASGVIAREASVPTFVLVDIFFGNGAVGGNLVSGFHQGETAANLALRILIEGVPAASIPVVNKSANRYYFDYRALSRFDLTDRVLPPGAIVIEKPKSFYEQYVALVWFSVALVVLLIFVIAGLTAHLQYRRRSEAMLRASEQETRSLFDTAFDAFFLHDFEGNVLEVNERTLELFGCTRAEALSASIFDFTAGEYTREQAIAFWETARVDGFLIVEWQARRFDNGHIFPVEVALRMTRIQERVLLQASTRDISEAKRIERELKDHRDHLEELVRVRTAELAKARDRAEAGARAKSAFLAHMSHEIRTPLNAILGFSHLLKQDVALTPDQQRHLETISRAGDHLLTLINSVLDMSRIEAGRVELDLKPFHLMDLLEEVMAMLSVRVKDRSVILSLLAPPDLPHWVIGDETKLRQVLVNLLGNAVKFTPRGRISLRVVVLAAHQLRFEVVDTGVGISASDTERIFSPFEQAKGSGASSLGSGLGLSISQHYVKLMGGDLVVDSTLGVGSTFSFIIALPPALQEEISHVRPLQVVSIVGDRPWRVLVADDHPANLELLKQTLCRVGFQVMTALNGEEALLLFEQFRPDAVLMDVNMPKMNGLEATRALRQRPEGATIPIIALSASVFDEDRRSVIEAGADEFLRKPCPAAELYRVLGERLGLLYHQAVLAESADVRLSAAEQRAAVHALPAELRLSLCAAAQAADQEQVLLLCEPLKIQHPRLAAFLIRLASEYKYDALTRLLDLT